MFGYATDETDECMPLTIVLAHKLNAKMAELRRDGTLPWLRPDSKTQVRQRNTISTFPQFIFITVEVKSLYLFALFFKTLLNAWLKCLTVYDHLIILRLYSVTQSASCSGVFSHSESDK